MTGLSERIAVRRDRFAACMVRMGWTAAVLVGLIGCLQGPVLAGKNKNGALIVHTNDAYVYSTQTACSTPLGDPGTCGGAVAGDKSRAALPPAAAFFPSASPGVTTIYFGIDYEERARPECLQVGGPGQPDLPDTDWPYSAEKRGGFPLPSQRRPFPILRLQD
jgi:hypothetical protein